MPLLALDHVSKSYPSGPGMTAALREVCLWVEPGECVAVWGPRASGKTTLLKVAAGLEAPESGTVRLSGEDVYRGAGTHGRSIGERVGWARPAGWEAEGLEALDCMALSLLDSVPDLRRARRESWEALAWLGISHIARTRCELLSACERAVMSIARAIVKRPAVLLADEPAAHLRPSERGSFMSLLRRVSEERSLAVLVTVPDIQSMVYAHRVGSLSDGWLAACQRPPRAYDNVLEFPSRGYATG